jgi:error-prone DNA polymerase
MNARDGKVAGDRRPDAGASEAGIGQSVMFITIEDETGVAKLVIWPSPYERLRRITLRQA